MITKPEDARPMTWDEYVDLNTNSDANIFLASECAEIARAYVKACEGCMLDGEDAPDPAVVLEQWEAKFKEWET